MSPVDDIIINKQMPQKKKGKGIIVLFFILLIILAGLCYAYYWYTTNMQETPKTAFFKYIVQTNIPEIADTELYYSILEKLNTESYETTTKADFTTTKKTNFTENVDVSKFDFALNIKSNKDKKESLIDANITYSSNDFFDLKLISTKDNVAIGSSEILDKYIATSKQNLSSSINKTTGAETDIDADFAEDKLKKFSDGRINFEEEYKAKKANEYMSIIVDKIPEEAVTLTEASPITMNSEVINTDAYTLTLDGQTYSSICKELLQAMRKDEELLSKLVTGTENEEEPAVQEAPKPITTIQPIGGQTEEHTTSQEIETEEQNLEVVQQPDFGALLRSEDSESSIMFSNLEDSEDEEEPENILFQILGAVLLNQKLDMSLEELQEKIDDEISNIKLSEGLKVTIYVKNVEGEEKQTIKLVAELPDNANLDIEYPAETAVKVTFLQDVTKTDEDGKEVTKNEGTSFEIKRTNSNTQTKFDIVINKIEEKKVVAKLQLDIITKGTKTTKNYTNDIIIKYNDNEGDYKINIENKLDFKAVNIEQELNEENTIFVDQLSDEEAANLYTTIILKLMDVYSEKILNMNFIDNNSASGVVEQPERVVPANINLNTDDEEVDEPEENDAENNDSEEQQPDEERTISKIDARNLLVAKIEEMMADAEDHEEEFSILNLQLLPKELDGWKVESEVTDEEATVTVAEYKFHIDKDFMLTEE